MSGGWIAFSAVVLYTIGMLSLWIHKRPPNKNPLTEQVLLSMFEGRSKLGKEDLLSRTIAEGYRVSIKELMGHLHLLKAKKLIDSVVIRIRCSDDSKCLFDGDAYIEVEQFFLREPQRTQ